MKMHFDCLLIWFVVVCPHRPDFVLINAPSALKQAASDQEKP